MVYHLPTCGLYTHRQYIIVVTIKKMKASSNALLPVCCLVLLILDTANAFAVGSESYSSPSHHVQQRRRRTRLFFQNETAVVEDEKVETVWKRSFRPKVLSDFQRHRLKRDLAVAAIEDYDMEAYNAGMTTAAEDLMKELEEVNPYDRPAYHPDMNARWSFVFTGVPTIGMRLITLLSRISVGLADSILEFDDVFLEVSKEQTQVKAIVAVRVFGNPLELNVYTRLRQPELTSTTCVHVPALSVADDGTHLLESFEKLVLCGVEIPTPKEWKQNPRDLQITYLDEAMMIARTAGGEPHLMLRHSPCSTDDNTCDIDDSETTPFFHEAMEKYGSQLSRSLVDRAYSRSDTSSQQGLDVGNILQLIHGIIFSPGH